LEGKGLVRLFKNGHPGEKRKKKGPLISREEKKKGGGTPPERKIEKCAPEGGKNTGWKEGKKKRNVR